MMVEEKRERNRTDEKMGVREKEKKKYLDVLIRPELRRCVTIENAKP